MNIPVPWSIWDPHTNLQFVEPISDKIQPNQSFGDAWGFHYRKLCKKLRFRQLRQHHGAFFLGGCDGDGWQQATFGETKGGATRLCVLHVFFISFFVVWNVYHVFFTYQQIGQIIQFHQHLFKLFESSSTDWK